MEILPMTSKISYVVIDTLHHKLSSIALERSMKEFPLDNVLIFSDQPQFWNGREVIEISEIKSSVDYNKIIFYMLPKILNTEYALFLQYDGYVLSGVNFNPIFLDYDYVGAPWPHFEHFNVGNGGFSLRSSRLINAIHQYLLPGDLEKPEDVIICRYLRARLEDDTGCKFAPASVARYFSFEMALVDHATFGYHGMYHLPKLMSDDIDVLLNNLHPNSASRVLPALAKSFGQLPRAQQDKFRAYCEKNFN